MSDDKRLIPKESTDLALHKTESLLGITDKILANKTLAVNDDAWVDELIAWAKTYRIFEKKSHLINIHF